MKKFCENIRFCLMLLYNANKFNFAILLLGNLISLLTPFVNLYISRYLINQLVEIVSKFNQEKINRIFCVITLYVLTNMFIKFWSNIIDKLMDLHLQDMVSYINMMLIKKSVNLDISYFDIPENFDHISKSRDNAQGLHQVIFSIFKLINNFITIITYFTIAVRTSISMSLIVFFFFVPSFLFKIQIDKKTYGFSKKQVRDIRKNNYIYNLLFSCVSAKELRFFYLGERFSKEYIKKARTLTEAKIKFTSDKKQFSTLLDIPSYLLQIIINIYIIIKILTREKTLGDYIFFTGVYSNLYSGLLQMANVLAEFMAYNNKINDFKQYFLLNESNIKCGSIKLDEIEKIEFKKVFFVYPGSKETVLKDISFILKRGEWALLIGQNGSGKSTICKLLARFYEPSSGEILINDVDISLYNLDILRKKISILFQDYNVYSFTIRENVAISNIDFRWNDSDIMSALTSVNIDYLLTKQNSDLDTYISKVFSDDGIELSGGEKQRLALARIFFKNNGVIVLDEPTAMLDALSENNILSKLQEGKRDKIIIMVSHKLLHAIYADKVIFFKNGEIIAQGTHTILYEENNEYRKLFNLQLDKYRTTVR